MSGPCALAGIHDRGHTQEDDLEGVRVARTASTRPGSTDGPLAPPGGHVERGETFVDGAPREVRAEVSVGIDPMDLDSATSSIDGL